MEGGSAHRRVEQVARCDDALLVQREVLALDPHLLELPHPSVEPLAQLVLDLGQLAVCTNTTNVWSGDNQSTKRERE